VLGRLELGRIVTLGAVQRAVIAHISRETAEL
jgi:hypothetical protein